MSTPSEHHIPEHYHPFYLPYYPPCKECPPNIAWHKENIELHESLDHDYNPMNREEFEEAVKHRDDPKPDALDLHENRIVVKVYAPAKWGLLAQELLGSFFYGIGSVPRVEMHLIVRENGTDVLDS